MAESSLLQASTASQPVEHRTLSMLGNSLTLIAGKLATMGLGFLAWVGAARVFDQHVVGVGSADVSAMMLCVQIALVGTGAAVISMYPQVRAEPGRLLNTSFAFTIVTSTLAAIGFLLIAWLFLDNLSVVATNPVNALALIIMTIMGTLGVLLDQLSTALRRGDQVLVRGVATGIATVGLVLLLPLWMDRSVETLLIAWAGGNTAPIIIGWWQVHHSLPNFRFRPVVDREIFRQINRVGIPNWVLTLTERTPGAILPLVVTEILTPQANAAWYAAWMMAWVVYVVPIQVGLNLFAESSHRPDQTHLALRQGVFSSLGIGIVAALGAAIVGPFLLEFLGSGYRDDGARPLQILVIGVIPFTFIQGYFAICRASFRVREAIIAGAISAASGIGAAGLAGSRFGLNGMAVAWLGTQSIVAIWSVSRLSRFGWSFRMRAVDESRSGQFAGEVPIKPM